MMKVTLISMGSLKEKYLREASQEYQKRLSAYCDLTVLERKPVRLPENPTEKEIATSLKREAAEIEKSIPENSTVIALCIEGKTLSSESFAQEIQSVKDAGKSLTFIIGSSYGLDETFKQKCAKRFSFSEMTFPHQLFRIMLLEQIYRAFRINGGGAYHK